MDTSALLIEQASTRMAAPILFHQKDHGYCRGLSTYLGASL